MRAGPPSPWLIESDLSLAVHSSPTCSMAPWVGGAGSGAGLSPQDACGEAAPLRSVSFSAAGDDVFEVTPYSEVYGRHPRSFHFGRYMRMLPVTLGYCFDPYPLSESDSEDETDSDEDLGPM